MKAGEREKASGGGYEWDRKRETEGALMHKADRVHQRARKPETGAVFPFPCLWYESVLPKPVRNWWEFLGIPWECCGDGLDFQDALGLSVIAIHPGWEDQDLGLPLLHVLGKNSSVTNKPASST